MDNEPQKKDIIIVLNKLINYEISRSEASNWAMDYLLDDEAIVDSKTHEIISAIGSVDLPSTDREYLYERGDFEGWLSALE